MGGPGYSFRDCLVRVIESFPNPSHSLPRMTITPATQWAPVATFAYILKSTSGVAILPFTVETHAYRCHSGGSRENFEVVVMTASGIA